MKADKPLTIYWLGNDLMWIKDMIYRGSPVDIVLRGVESSWSYLVALDVPQLPLEYLAKAEESILLGNYDAALMMVDQIKSWLHVNLLEHEPDFRKAR